MFIGISVQKLGLKATACLGGALIAGGSIFASYAPAFGTLHIAFGLYV
jgi:hypothetical protein